MTMYQTCMSMYRTYMSINTVYAVLSFMVRRGQQKMRWLKSITYSMNMNLSKLQEIVKDKEACYWGPALPGSRDSLRRVVLAVKRIENKDRILQLRK